MRDDELDALLASTKIAHSDDAALYAHARGTLEPAAAAELERHLSGCPDCRALAEALAEPPNPALMAAGRAALLEKRRRIAPLVIALAAAAAAVLAIAVLPLRTPEFNMEGPFGGVHALRDDREISRRFDANSRVELIFRPAAPTAEVELLVSLDGVPVAAGAVEHGAEGALIYRVPARALFGEARGAHRADFALRRAGRTLQTFTLELEYLGEKEEP